MGRPGGKKPDGTPSVNNNSNPLFTAQHTPQPPVKENQPSAVPMGRPAQPTNINNPGRGNPQRHGENVVRPPPNTINQPSNWSSGLFDCMNDGENAIITFCFPFVTFGQIAEVIDEGATTCGSSGMLYGLICCLFWAPCIYSCTFRAKLRNKYGLPDAPAPDWITHCFCEYCALCQEYRELKTRGLDPAIGWIGNVQKYQSQQQEMMAPPMGQRMMG